MAEYANGYNRKFSDNKKLIIFLCSIVLGVALIVGIVALINNVGKNTETYSSLNKNVITYDKVLEQEEDKYLVYFYTDNDELQSSILDLIKAYKGEEGQIKIYLVKYPDLTDDNKTALKTTLNYNGTIQTTLLFAIAKEGDAHVTLQSHIYTSASTIKSNVLNDLKNKELPNWLK